MTELDFKNLGVDLQRARKRRRLTQADVARSLDLSRTTVTAIEKGERKVSLPELQAFAQLYGTQLSDFVRERPQPPTFGALFRTTLGRFGSEAKEMEATVIEVEDLARDYLELERINEAFRRRDFPPPHEGSVARIDVEAAAMASRERARMNLGSGPVRNFREILENEVGLAVFCVPMSSKFAGLFFYSDELGGCIAVNTDHPPEKQLWTLAHEYGHFLFHRHELEMLPADLDPSGRKTEELAEAFAMHLLMPTEGILRKAHSLWSDGPGPTVADMLTFANYFGVSLEALFRTLEGMDLVPVGFWKSIKSGIRVRELQGELGLVPRAPMSFLPVRYTMLATAAYCMGRISEGRFARFLRKDRIGAREMAKSFAEQSGE